MVDFISKPITSHRDLDTIKTDNEDLRDFASSKLQNRKYDFDDDIDDILNMNPGDKKKSELEREILASKPEVSEQISIPKEINVPKVE